MPSFGADMQDGTLSQWLVSTGDRVARNDVIAIIETQKGAIDLEVFTSGIVSKLLVAAGERVAVGTPIALIDDGVITDSVATEEPPRPAVPVAQPIPESATQACLTRPSIVPPAPGQGRVRATPLARRLAAEQAVDLSAIKGSGPAGEILARDMLPAATAPAGTPPMDIPAMRHAISAAMSRSKREIPHYYLEQTINLQRAANWLAEYNQDKAPEDRLVLNALLHLAVARALQKSPELNGFYQQGQFVAAEEIHLGTAIAIRGGGLITPAIINADQLDLDEMMKQLLDLSYRVRNGGLRSSEMSLGSVTLSSMGDRGAEKVFGVIYPPQVAIIGLGTPELRPWVNDGKIEPGLLVSATLAADHRVSDGRQGARFLNHLNKILQKPERL